MIKPMKNSLPKVNGHLVFMSDFGLKDRFVTSMKGVAIAIESSLQLHDITHQIAPYNIWEASYTLAGSIPYWPTGTVFVSVVDPGVGTDRASVVAQTHDDKFIVTPDNGTLTLIDDQIGIDQVRLIDETINRRPGSSRFATFHGRDIYAYTGARLASQTINYRQAGAVMRESPRRIDYTRPAILDNQKLQGTLAKVEHPYGNLATNIPAELFYEAGGANETYWNVEIAGKESKLSEKPIPFTKSFGFVDQGGPLIYIDSLGNLGLALNNGNMSDQFGITPGPEETIVLNLMK